MVKKQKKKQTRRRKRGKSRQVRNRNKRRIILYSILLLMTMLALYIVYLDDVIKDRFEGNRWELPARVYARPLELFIGAHVSKTAFMDELRGLKYRKVSHPKQAGTYQVGKNGIVFNTRAFQFWDGHESAKRLRIRFRNGSVSGLENVKGGPAVDLVRLDPIRIASIYPKHNEDRVLVRLADVPDILIKGLIEVEDRKFMQHSGLDYLAILRALVSNIRAGKTVQGGSTLTQQLVKNYFLTNKRSLTRKLHEALMAKLVEWHYSKNDILESYINEVYLGQDGKRSVNGFGLASQFYFHRKLKYLGVHQVALLIGLVKGPSYYDPRRHPGRALARRNLVLDIMFKRGLITKSKSILSKRLPLGVVRVQKNTISEYYAFLDLVKRQLRRDYKAEDLSSAGLRILTTLDPVIQRKAEQSLSGKLAGLERDHDLSDRKLQGAVIVSDTGSAEIVAVVGDRRSRYSGFNRALDAVRPVGSLIKPAVYLAALKTPGYTLATLIDDDPLEVEQKNGVWAPQNYNHIFHGEVPLFMALVNSYNVATVRLGMHIGLSSVVRVLSDLGIRRPIIKYPSTLLGTLSMSPLEVTQMYQTLAGSGFYSPLRSIRAVLDTDGKPLNRYPLSVSQVVSPQNSLLINYTLHLVTRIGTAKQLQNLLPAGMKVAGKTGTTDDRRDSWFAGYTGDYLAVVWVGYDDNKPTKFSGSTGAMQIWAKLMNIMKARPLSLSPVENIEMAWIDIKSGNKTEKNCKSAVELPFKSGTIPDQTQQCATGASNWLDRIFGQ